MPHAERIDWIDCAKGICIVLVVMLYAADWVPGALASEGWLHGVVEFARPFRMPDFFLVSGLLLSRTIGRGWMVYLDRKVLHFAYFYALWLTIAFLLLGPAMAAREGASVTVASYLHAFVRPYSWLWFIYMLPVFFVVTKLVLPLRPALVWLAAAALHLAQLESDLKVLDKFAQYYVFFYAGYAAAPLFFRIARAAAARPLPAIAALAVWSGVNGWLVASGAADEAFASLGLGLAGAAAVIAVSALIAEFSAGAALRFCGRNSIVIYLAFFIPGIAARAALTRLDLVRDPGAMALLVTLAGVVGALVIAWVARRSRLGFLFERPAWFRLSSGNRRPAGVSWRRLP